MAHLYKVSEWQGGSGKWYCNDVTDLAGVSGKWVVPARILGLTPAEFLKFLIEKFEPDHIFHNEDCSFVGWGWSSQSQMRKYKNWINAEARKKNFKI